MNQWSWPSLNVQLAWQTICKKTLDIRCVECQQCQWAKIDSKMRTKTRHLFWDYYFVSMKLHISFWKKRECRPLALCSLGLNLAASQRGSYRSSRLNFVQHFTNHKLWQKELLWQVAPSGSKEAPMEL